MTRTRLLLPLVLLPSLLACACSAPTPSDGDDSEAQSESLVSAVTIPSTAGATTTKTIAVSGAERLSTPETYNWSCGRSNAGWYTSPSNVAWVEVKNPSTNTANVTVALSGASASSAKLFAYGSKSAALIDCRSFGREKLSGSGSLVLAGGSSVWILVDVGSSTGVFTLDVTTDRLATVKPTLAIAAAAGATSETQVAIDGATKQSTPETYNWSCGRSNAGWYTSPSNVTWLEIMNPTAEAASVTVALDGPGASSTKLFAYESKTSSPTDCLSFGTSGKLTGSRGLVLDAGASTWVLVDGGSRTGVMDVRVTTDRLTGAAPPGKVTVATTEGGTVDATVVLDGRTRRSTPETYNWSCGRSNAGWYTSPSNVAWLEVENPTPSTVSLSLAASGPSASTKKMFVYASKSAASTDCITFTTSGKLTGARSVVVEPNASVWVLLDGNDDTGIYDVTVATDALVDP